MPKVHDRSYAESEVSWELEETQECMSAALHFDNLQPTNVGARTQMNDFAAGSWAQ
jgi:hypothetical protein